MAKGHLALGIGSGFTQEMANIKDEKERQEDRSERKSELEYVRNRRTKLDAHYDEDRARGLEDADTSRKRNNTLFEQSQQDRGLKLKDDATQRDREDTLWAQSQETMATRLQEEGLDRFLTSIEGGADPNMAVDYFNKTGKFKIRPGSVTHDKVSGKLSFVGEGGQRFDGTTKQLRALLGGKPSEQKLHKIGKEDRLVNERGDVIVGPDPSSAGGDGPKRSPFNFQTYSKTAADSVKEALGAKFDSAMNQWFIPAGMSDKIAFANGLTGQVARHFDGRITAQEVASIVTQVSKEIPTYDEATQRAKREVSGSDQVAIRNRANEIIRAAKVVAAQDLNTLIEQQEQALNAQQVPQQMGGEPQEGEEAPPIEYLKEGYEQEFDNGQVWTLKGGRPVRVR